MPMTADSVFREGLAAHIAGQGMSVAAAARAAKIPVRSLQSVFDGKKPSIARAATICERLGFRFVLGPDEGSRPVLPASNDQFAWGDRRGKVVTPYDVPLRKGHAPEMVGFSPNGCASYGLEFLLTFDLNPEMCEVIEFKDNSMLPGFPAGAAGLVDLRRTDPVDGWVFVIEADRLLVRRMRNLGGTWTAMPDNRRHKPSLWDDSFRIIGKVVWTSRVVDVEPIPGR